MFCLLASRLNIESLHSIILSDDFHRDTDCQGPRIGPIVSGGIGIGNPPFPDNAIESFQ